MHYVRVILSDLEQESVQLLDNFYFFSEMVALNICLLKTILPDDAQLLDNEFDKW